MQRDLASFPLPVKIRSKLLDRGFSTVNEICQLGSSELSKGGNKRLIVVVALAVLKMIVISLV